ncbi:afln vera monooxygenase protein [Apiospora hydei]|uniref:Afln vera monooxygenase protein n=1 Tax=Apiospora hydei TaxID=1337664 RepID=A0ABR1WBP2_9PEZI
MYQSTIILVCLFALLVQFLVKYYNARRRMQKLQRAGLPMPPFSLLTGHSAAFKAVTSDLPRDATMHTILGKLSEAFPGGIFYLNLWPFFSGTWAVVTSPRVAVQVQALNLPKPETSSGPVDTITGGPSLTTMTGDVWKRWRTLFNPGFSPNYLLQLAPLVVKEVEVFCALLREQARKGHMFQLEDFTLRLTVDLIAVVALDTRLHFQTQPSPLALALQRQIEWASFGSTLNPLKRYLTVRSLVLWYNARRMNTFIGAEIDKRHAELGDDSTSGEPDGKTEGPSPLKSKSVMSLALKQYLAEQKHAGIMTSQLCLFLFAGRDTTSSTLLYCFYLLAKHAKVLERVREEHNQVLGSSDVREAGRIISESPHKLNQLPYTTAVIKETLRLFAPAAAMREGRAGVDLVDDDGRRCPTEGCYVWSLTPAIHHNRRAWGETADEFRPERWLQHQDQADEENATTDGTHDDPALPNPGKGAWRPFEPGPRNCIGQTLVMLELRIALVMTLREFDIVPAYAEWDAENPGQGVKMVDGERAYQAVKADGGEHPADGLPCRVHAREQ